MKKKILIIPSIIFFFILFVFFYLIIIDRNPSELPSALINKKAPIFKARTLLDDNIFVSEQEFGHETIIVNFFATWCKPCLDEHVHLMRLAKEKNLRIVGINYKDNSKKTIKWLKELGNPYSHVLIDSDARLGIEWGVYGMPETFIVNSKGTIKYRLVGPITQRNYNAFNIKIKESEQ